MLRLIRYSHKCGYQFCFTLFLNRTCEALAERILAVSSWGAILPFRLSESYRCRLSLERRQSSFF
jgi:hypothetical protein